MADRAFLERLSPTDRPADFSLRAAALGHPSTPRCAPRPDGSASSQNPPAYRPAVAFSSRLTERTLAVARAALAIAPLIRKGRAWLHLAPRSHKARFFSNETIAHLIATGEAVRIGNVVCKLSVCLFVASILWSCVMPSHARPIASRMSAAERAALHRTEGS